MGWDPSRDGAEIEEVAEGRGGAPRAPGAGRRLRGAGGGRWLPLVAVGGLAVVIVGAGLAGPKLPVADDATPSAGPGGTAAPAAATPPAASAYPTPIATRVPGVRFTGAPLEDPALLLAGRWVDLATGTAIQDESGCELARPLVLTGGRIVCVADEVLRPPGSTLATYDLSVLTLGRARRPPAEPWREPPPTPLAEPAPASHLMTLVGRRDLAFGDPVAIAAAPGGERDALVLAWAILGDDGYRVGLSTFTVGDAPQARRTGSWNVLAVALDRGSGPVSLADLAVHVSPDGSTALVGVTVAGAPGSVAERRLVTVRLDGQATNGGVRAAPVPLPIAVTAGPSPPTAVGGDGPAACGGLLDEGWAADDTLFVVCAGRPSFLRRIALGSGLAGDAPSPPGGAGTPGPSVAAAILDEIALPPAGSSEGNQLAANGAAIDRERGRYYRWSPWSRTLWAVDLGARAGAHATAASITLPAAGGPGLEEVVPGVAGTGLIPIAAVDPAADRLYLLLPGAQPGGGATIFAVEGSELAPLGSLATASEPFATMALSPDGRLLYVATPPRGVAGAPVPMVAAEVLATDPLGERLFAGRLPPSGWDPAQPLGVR